MTGRLLQYKLSFITQCGAPAASADSKVRCRSETLIFHYTLALNEMDFCMWRETPPSDVNAESTEQLSHGNFPRKMETYH